METGYQRERFGVVAVKKGFVTAEQTIRALALQVIEENSKKMRRPIGRILLGQGAISISQLDQVLSDIEKI
jgi:hypothetical protein